jgi:hypothetical protein
MIMSFTAANALHASYRTYLKGMTQIRSIGLCGVDEKVGEDGLFQVPDWVFDGGRPKYGELPVCAKCVSVVHKMKEPPK